MSELLHTMRQTILAVAAHCGVGCAEAEAIANRVEDNVRLHQGGHKLYIPSLGLVARDERVRREFNGRNRDTVCSRHGISRSTFYRIIGSKVTGGTDR